MAVPVLKLNLAPPSTFWRSQHPALGWGALVLGGLILAGSLGFTVRAYRSAAEAGRRTVSLAAETRSTAQAQAKVLADLRNVDVAKELPQWRLAERIYSERSLPWSRLTAELERSMVEDVRIKSIQRNRGSDMRVQLKIKGEAQTRDAEAAFVESLQKNAFFEQVILEREGERQGGGVDFDYTLAAATVPPPYQPLPKYGPPRKAAAHPAVGQSHGASAGIAVPPPSPPGRLQVPVPAAPVNPVPHDHPAPNGAFPTLPPRMNPNTMHPPPVRRHPVHPEDEL
jgi:hypothetical protein